MMSQATPYSRASRADHAHGPARKTLSVSRPTGRPVTVSTTPASARPPGVLDSSELLQGASCVNITHNGQIYQLRATRHGKLILTK